MLDILHRVGIKSSPDKVYRALATREGLAGWWTDDTQADSQVGGALSFRFHANGKELGHMDMQFLELDPARRVVWKVTGGEAEWIGTTISWDIKQEDDYAIVLFKHQGWKEPGEFMHHCSTKWAIFMMSLKSLVETGQGAASPNDVKIDNWN